MEVLQRDPRPVHHRLVAAAQVRLEFEHLIAGQDLLGEGGHVHDLLEFGGRRLGDIGAEEPVQFERLGYFCLDSEDDAPDRRVFNRIVTLRDSWAKLEKQAMQQAG